MREEDKEEPKTEEEQEELTEAPEEAETEEKAEEEEAEAPEEAEEGAEEPEKEEEKAGEEKPEEAAEAEEEAAPAEEAKPEKEEKPEEEEIVEERVYTVPLSRAWIMPPNKRAPRAMRMVRSFVTKHMKLEARKEGEEEEEPKKLVISNEVNERVWSRGIEKPPRKIRIRTAKDKEGNITVYLAEGD